MTEPPPLDMRKVILHNERQHYFLQFCTAFDHLLPLDATLIQAQAALYSALTLVHFSISEDNPQCQPSLPTSPVDPQS